MKNDLLRFDKNQKYMVMDFETCGLNLFSSKPWQLSYVLATGNQITSKYDHWIDWPSLEVSPGAAMVTGFSYDKYNKLKKPASPILDEFEKILYNPEYIIVGQNLLGFDIYIHNIYRRLEGKNPDFSYLPRVVDTVCLAKARVMGVTKIPKEKRIYSMYKYLNTKLPRGSKVTQLALLKDLDIEFEESRLHDSLYDVEKNFEIFNKLIWEVEV